MRATRLVPVLAAAALTMAGCVAAEDEITSSESLAMEMGDGGGHTGHNCPGPEPIMQVGDFNGDGVVSGADVATISDFKDSGRYAAFFDMDADGDLDGQDVAAVAQNVGSAGTARDAQMAQLWATTYPYKYGIPSLGLSGLQVAVALGGYEPFTPNLAGHGIHFANMSYVFGWAALGGFSADRPEGLNYTATGDLVAAFYYAPAAADLADPPFNLPLPQDSFYLAIDVPDPSFDGIMKHEWHHHVGACFGGATEIPGFDQCMTKAECDAVGGTLWSPEFHMIHVWLYEYNECGPFGGIDEDVSPEAPPEPHHGECTAEDVTCIVMLGPDGTPMTDENGLPMCADSDGGDHGDHM